MDTHVMRMVKSWWSNWSDRQADPEALVALADGIHRLIREAEAEARRQVASEDAFRAGPPNPALLSDAPPVLERQ